MRWEVRDSTLEFVGQLAKGCDASRALLEACCTTPLLREALQDTESYVRATAISALAKTLAYDWQQGAALSQEEVGSGWAVFAFVFSFFFSMFFQTKVFELFGVFYQLPLWVFLPLVCLKILTLTLSFFTCILIFATFDFRETQNSVCCCYCASTLFWLLHCKREATSQIKSIVKFDCNASKNFQGAVKLQVTAGVVQKKKK